MQTTIFPTRPLPSIRINSDDHERVSMLADRVSGTMPYVAAYLDRELRRAELCQPWERAGVSMGDRVMFLIDDDPAVRMGRLAYPGRTLPEKGNVPILGAVGAALIGMHRKSSIEWLDEGRLRTLTVLDYGW